MNDLKTFRTVLGFTLVATLVGQAALWLRLNRKTEDNKSHIDRLENDYWQLREQKEGRGK